MLLLHNYAIWSRVSIYVIYSMLYISEHIGTYCSKPQKREQRNRHITLNYYIFGLYNINFDLLGNYFVKPHLGWRGTYQTKRIFWFFKYMCAVLEFSVSFGAIIVNFISRTLMSLYFVRTIHALIYMTCKRIMFIHTQPRKNWLFLGSFYTVIIMSWYVL